MARLVGDHVEYENAARHTWRDRSLCDGEKAS